MIMWSNEQVEQWRLRRKSYLEDIATVTHDKDIDQRRPRAQREMIHLLNSFLDGSITLKEFNVVFQRKTHSEWRDFHAGGMSGGMFLNKLVKYTPNEGTFAQLLRLMLHVPEGTRDGQWQMRAFVRFLEGLIASEQVQRAQLQPARVPFFLSLWWHMQASGHWPICYAGVRGVLLAEEETVASEQGPADTYFEFRERFLSLRETLGLSSWELEHLCLWQGLRTPLRSTATEKRTPSVVETLREQPAEVQPEHAQTTQHPALSAHKEKRAAAQHTHLQWLLAKLGHKVGCRVWIAGDDHDKVWKDERLGSLSLDFPPVGAPEQLQPILRRIDVLWLQKNEVVAAYEIIQASTDVSADLLRLYDVGALFPKRAVQLCVVTPRQALERVRFELSRPAFLEHAMRKHCALIDEELLLQHEEHVLRWATGPSVVKELVEQFGAAK